MKNSIQRNVLRTMRREQLQGVNGGGKWISITPTEPPPVVGLPGYTVHIFGIKILEVRPAYT